MSIFLNDLSFVLKSKTPFAFFCSLHAPIAIEFIFFGVENKIFTCFKFNFQSLIVRKVVLVLVNFLPVLIYHQAME
jgi:hypothetical protein